MQFIPHEHCPLLTEYVDIKLQKLNDNKIEVTLSFHYRSHPKKYNFAEFLLLEINDVHVIDGLNGSKKRLGINYRTKQQWKQMYKDNIIQFIIPNTDNDFIIINAVLGKNKYEYDTEFESIEIKCE
jgi:hypothetical protein